MRAGLDTQLAVFLRRKRGDTTYAQFARRLGISASTLYRLEHGEQSITLERLEQIMMRLRCSIGDIFNEEGA